MKILSRLKSGNGAGFVRSIPSDLAEVDPVCQAARDVLDSEGQGDRYFTVDLLLREFLNNAILHGHGSDRRKLVQVSFRVGRKWIVLRIADQGRGFDWRGMRRRPPEDTATSGRGLIIGTQYARRLQFNHTGNEVVLWVKKTETEGCHDHEHA